MPSGWKNKADIISAIEVHDVIWPDPALEHISIVWILRTLAISYKS